MKKVFISYSSQDTKIVEEITTRLEKAGIEYWKAPEMIPAGSSYAREIPVAIRECAVFLLVVSATSQESIWVEKEVDCAVNARKTIVPFKISAHPLTEVFRFYLNNVQTINYYEYENKAWETLINRLERLLHPNEMKKILEEPVKERPKRTLSIEPPRKQRRTLLSTRQQPVICDECGGRLERVSMGTFKCEKCGNITYDDYQIVRNYLEKKGPCSSIVIAKETGISRRKIDEFLKDEMLEIVKGAPVCLTCEKCGAPIRYGRLCEKCKNSER